MKWPIVQLGDCARIVGGATPATGIVAYWDGDIDWATPKDLSALDTPYIHGTPRKITAEGLRNCSSEILPEGSVLFSSRAPIGHVAINLKPMATNQGFKSFIPDRNRLHNSYLYWWLKANRSYLEGLGNGATFKEVSKSVVARVEIPLPPLDEQRRIAAILDQGDALRRKRREAALLLEQMSSVAFHERFGDPIENPKRYASVNLSEIIDPARPITYGILMPGPHDDAGVPYVRVVDIKSRMIQEKTLRKTSHAIDRQYRRSTLREGDVLISIRGHVGRTAIVPKTLDGANITQDTARLSICGALPQFIESMLNTIYFRRWFKRYTKGVAVQGINLGDLKKAPIILPARKEQQFFVELVQAIGCTQSAMAQQLEEAETMFSSIQHRAFRGEL